MTFKNMTDFGSSVERDIVKEIKKKDPTIIKDQIIQLKKMRDERATDIATIEKAISELEEVDKNSRCPRHKQKITIEDLEFFVYDVGTHWSLQISIIDDPERWAIRRYTVFPSQNKLTSKELTRLIKWVSTCIIDYLAMHKELYEEKDKG
jgi:hypothetical protein